MFDNNTLIYKNKLCFILKKIPFIANVANVYFDNIIKITKSKIFLYEILFSKDIEYLIMIHNSYEFPNLIKMTNQTSNISMSSKVDISHINIYLNVFYTPTKPNYTFYMYDSDEDLSIDTLLGLEINNTETEILNYLLDKQA